MKVYDTAFNANEWFILILIIIGITAMLIAPKKFSKIDVLTYFLSGVYLGMLSDHTLSVEPFNLYDVNDTSHYSLFDFLSYISYGPFSYFFIYFYQHFAMKGFKLIIYILAWSLISLPVETLGVFVGEYHYNKGYHLYYSFAIYLALQTMLIVFYHALNKPTQETNL